MEAHSNLGITMVTDKEALLLHIPETEYQPFHSTYIRLLPEGNVLDILRRQTTLHFEMYYGIDAGMESFCYAPSKWNVKQVIGHMMDTERILTYRALCFARGEQQSLPGFDENAYGMAFPASTLSLAEILTEFRAVRLATFTLFDNLTADGLLREGHANGAKVSVRALLGIISGHERHHVKVLNERYGIALPSMDIA
jgi:hypothetical protein